MTANQRIVVTGMGPVAPNGIGLHAFWGALVEGRSAIRPVQSVDVSRHTRKFGGEVQGFDPVAFMSEETAKGTGRTSQLAIAAASIALDDARFSEVPHQPFLAIGSTLGDMAEVESIDDDWQRDGTIDPH
jgi:3-oxoacyl-[acyl-carrier-protein] synthase II